MIRFPVRNIDLMLLPKKKLPSKNDETFRGLNPGCVEGPQCSAGNPLPHAGMAYNRRRRPGTASYYSTREYSQRKGKVWRIMQTTGASP